MKRRADENATPLGCANRGVQLMKHSDLEEAEKRKGRPESTAGLALPRETCFKPLPRRNNFTEKRNKGHQRPPALSRGKAIKDSLNIGQARVCILVAFFADGIVWRRRNAGSESMLQHAPRPCSLALPGLDRFDRGDRSQVVIGSQWSVRPGKQPQTSSSKPIRMCFTTALSLSCQPSQRSNTTWFVIAHAQKAGYCVGGKRGVVWEDARLSSFFVPSQGHWVPL